MNNSSIRFHHYHLESLNEPKAINDVLSLEYDAIGAACFIIVVIIWYSLGLVFMLGIQIRARTEAIEDFARRRAKFFIQTIRDQTQTREILGLCRLMFHITFLFIVYHCLEELVDKEKREKLWQIYWGSSNIATNDQDLLRRAEIHRIRKIKKQLAIINRNRLIMNDTFVSPVMKPTTRPPSVDSHIVFSQTETTTLIV